MEMFDSFDEFDEVITTSAKRKKRGGRNKKEAQVAVPVEITEEVLPVEEANNELS